MSTYDQKPNLGLSVDYDNDLVSAGTEAQFEFDFLDDIEMKNEGQQLFSGAPHFAIQPLSMAPHQMHNTNNNNNTSKPYEPLFPEPTSSNLFHFEEEGGFGESTGDDLLSKPPSSQQSHSHLTQPTDPTQKLLNEITVLEVEQREKLERMGQVQKQLIIQNIRAPNPSISMLEEEQKALKLQLDGEIKALSALQQQVTLEPQDFHRVLMLEKDLAVQLKQLELYYFELQQHAHNSPPRCIAALVLLQQPFPFVINKGKQLHEDQLVVKLLSGSNTEFISFSPIKTVVVFDNQTPGTPSTPSPAASSGAAKQPQQKPIELDVQMMDLQTRQAKFPLKFSQGTRKGLVTLRFGMQVQVQTPQGAFTATIESAPTLPFIVITNESQWEGSEGIILKKDAFEGRSEVTWPSFANSLQRRFLAATRQDAVNPKRPLSQYDIHYVHQKFFNAQGVVNQKQNDEFWSWFGKCLQTLRYQRHISSLWQNGLLSGLLSREDVEAALAGQDPGTFIIRFSERHAGQFGIGYIAVEQKIKHYLVQPNDTAGAKKTLPDFVQAQSQLAFILQCFIDPVTSQLTFRKSLKEQALDPYISKRDTNNPRDGYEMKL